MSSEHTAYNFLHDSGEMGKLIRAKDWHHTSLGDPQNWSQPLKTAVRMVLDNPFGQNILWGHDYIQIYNDSYRPIMGTTKHPHALGSSAKDTWSEIWHIVGPMLDQVLKGDSVSFKDYELQLNRHGYLEDCYFDFSYSPIRLENGVIGGVLVTSVETTTKKEAQDNLKLSIDELEFVIEATKLATFDYIPMTNKFSGNARLKEWFGLPRNEEIDLTEATNAIIDSDRNRIELAIESILKFDSGGEYDEKYTVVNALTNKETNVHAKGRVWYNDDQIAYRFTGTLEDITEQTTANIKTKETESHIRKMILDSPVGICLLDAATLRSETVNESFVDIAGTPREQIIDHYFWDLFPDVKDLFYETLHQIVELGEAYNGKEVELSLNRQHTEEKLYVSFVFVPLVNDHDKVVKVAVWAQNNTKQVEARKEITVSESNLRLMILQAPIAIAIFRGADYNVEIANKFALELWGRTENEVLNLPLFECMPELLDQGIKDLVDGVSKTGSRFSTPEMPVKFMRDGILQTRYINFSFEALFDSKGIIDGIMALGFDITAQVDARKKIEESEQSIRALVESAPFPIGVYQGEELRIILANQTIIDYYGKGDDVIGKSYTDILPELENQEIFEQIRGVLRNGISFHAKNQKVDIVTNGAIKTYYFNYSFTPVFDATGAVYAVMNTAADVTELQNAKKQVEESEKRFRQSVRQAPVGIAIFKGRGHIAEMANENYLQLIDRTEDQLLGKPLFEVLPEVELTLAPILDDIFKTGDDFYGYEFPVPLSRKGKTEIQYFNFVYHPLVEDNEISGFIAVATNVTTTVIAKQLIKESQEKLKLVIDGSELGIFDVDLKGSSIIASDRLYEILGFKDQKNLTNEQLLANFHPDDLNTREKAFEHAYIDGKLQYQTRIIWNDNSLHWMEAKGKIYYDAANVPERILGTVRDITDERNFQQELVEREEKFRLLADSMPQYIWTADPEGNLTYFNQSTYDFVGYEPGTLNNEGWTNIVHPDDREENIKHWQHAINTGENYLFEQRFKKHNGEYRWQLSRAIPQRDADGVIKRWVGTSTDIQEQKMFTTELENMVRLRTKELEQKNIDLEKMNKELQSFVYISSHDLQEPLRKIQTFSSRIIDTELETLSDTGKKHFERMQKSAYRMQNLIQDLIAYSRTTVQEADYEVVDLSEMIEDVKETLSEELEQNDVTFELKDICDVKIIPVKFKQVVLNLITNSIKFSKKGQPVTISISCDTVKGDQLNILDLAKHKQYSHIQFTDNGIGFEEEYNEKIFEVFQRLHSKDDYSGTGIGLAIVKRIIENHEGIIKATGKINKGATFDIFIPAP